MAYVTGHNALRRDASSPSVQRVVKLEGTFIRPSLGNTGSGGSGAGIMDVGIVPVLKIVEVQHDWQIQLQRIDRVAGEVHQVYRLSPRDIERATTVGTDVGIHVTASFGIASYPNHAATKEDLISAADAAMLLVKSTTKDEIGVARAIDSGRGQARR